MSTTVPDDGRGKNICDVTKDAFVTMVTSDDFVVGAEVMLHSLREHCCNKKRQRAVVVMVTSGVSEAKRNALRDVSSEIIEVSAIDRESNHTLPTSTCVMGKLVLMAWLHLVADVHQHYG